MEYKEERINLESFESKMDLDRSKYVVGKNCRASFNTQVKHGVLSSGKGFEVLTLPALMTDRTEYVMFEQTFSFVKIWHYTYYSIPNNCQEYLLVALGNDGKLYFSAEFSHIGEFASLSNTVYSSIPTTINFTVEEDSVIGFAFEDRPLVVWYCDDPIYEVEDAPYFRSICLHGDRLFAIDASKDNIIRYSSNKNPLDWKKNVISSDDAGSLELNDYKGSLRKLVSFKDSIYVFEDYGISKISAYSSSDEYFATNIYTSGSKIYANTACKCGDLIYFLCEDGLYSLDGVDIKKLELNISSLLDREQLDASICFFNKKLYIACHLDFEKVGLDNGLVTQSNSDDGSIENEEAINNALIEFNIEDNTYTIIKGIDVCSMVAINDLFLSKLIVALRNKKLLYQLTDECKIVDTNLSSSWESGVITLDSRDKNKILKDIYLLSKYPAKILVTSDKRSKEIDVPAKDNLQRLGINLPGKEFSFKIFTNSGNLHIENLQLRFKVEN